MGGGGSIAAMNSSLKNNRNQLTKRKKRVHNVKDYFVNSKVKAKRALTNKAISKEKLERINAKIRVEAQKRRKGYLIFTIAMISIAAGLFLVMMLMI